MPPFKYQEGKSSLFRNKEFIAPVFIADSEDVTPIFGRAKTLDLFKVCFDGSFTNIEEK